MTDYTIHVSQLSPQTTHQHLHDFFTFCGKIQSIEFNESAHTATIHFEKPQAAKTALMLNGGTLDGAHISVTSENVHLDGEDKHHDSETHDGTWSQEDKPKAGIIAEYLAKGYKLSDSILQRAIEYDTKQGISTRFLSYIQELDKKIGQKAVGPDQTVSGKLQEAVAQAQAQAKAVDEQKGLTAKAADYYTRALSSPFGQKVKQFYTTTSKQVLDIHEEALRIANLHHKYGGSGSHPAGGTHDSSTGLGSAAPPLDPAVQSTGIPTPGSAGAGISGGPGVAGKDTATGKSGEAPLVV
ncbi:hypothetical protein K474DRAFT_1660690 [Panus rudis PR-1116 ss-1]|nr:hypothetical protein K474DRAFT_1660690 [Panus rudis PR-1116 ss-1]